MATTSEELVQVAEWVGQFIRSGFTEPSEELFQLEVKKWKPELIHAGIKKCDQLRENFIHTHGPNAPGIKYCERARKILQNPQAQFKRLDPGMIE